MNDVRSFASLSGSLLARKGGAKPAMRPRPIGTGTMLDDLGWDDMGYAAEQPAQHVPSSIAGLTPVPRPISARDEQPPVHIQQRTLAERFSEPTPVPPPVEASQVAAEVVEPAPEPQPALEVVESAPEPQPAAETVQPASEPQPAPEGVRPAPMPAPAAEIVKPAPVPAPAPAPQPRGAAQVVDLPKRAAPSQGRKAAFTLRLDNGRHLRLRLATAVTGQSAQHLVTAALDRFLETLPEVGNMAEQLPVRSTKRS